MTQQAQESNVVVADPVAVFQDEGGSDDGADWGAGGGGRWTAESDSWSKVIVSWVLSIIFLPFPVAGFCWVLARESFKYGVELSEEMCDWIYSD